ncbi:MAG TPA: hypothetical protein VHB77_14305 [Planctomycetaceae bacterium]|nr:hypothetical protein [Planctomycetaceae bacterium]
MSTRVEEDRWRKVILGVIVAACFVTAAVVYFFFPDQQSVLSASIRIGAVLGALWMALPAPGERIGIRWARIAPLLSVAVVLIVATRKMILVLIPALIVVGILLALLRPKDKGGRAPLR